MYFFLSRKNYIFIYVSNTETFFLSIVGHRNNLIPSLIVFAPPFTIVRPKSMKNNYCSKLPYFPIICVLCLPVLP